MVKRQRESALDRARVGTPRTYSFLSAGVMVFTARLLSTAQRRGNSKKNFACSARGRNDGPRNVLEGPRRGNSHKSNGKNDCYLFDPYDAERVPLEVLWKGLEKKMAERAARGNYEPRMKEAEAVVILRYNPLYGYQVCTGNFNLITDYIYSLDPSACIISAIERLIEEAEK